MSGADTPLALPSHETVRRSGGSLWNSVRTAVDRNNEQGSLGATIAAVLVLTGTIGALYLPLFLR
jgi:hypothetical protein